MKTAIHQLIDEIKQEYPNSEIDFTLYLLMEKEELCQFWIEGNKQGWTMQTDWPEDAEKHYQSKFQTTEELINKSDYHYIFNQ